MTEFSSELTLLLLAVGLTFIQLIISILGATQQLGLSALAGNRENMVPTNGWVGRAQRAHVNMLENLVLFAILVIVARLIGVSNDLTILGSQLFFCGPHINCLCKCFKKRYMLLFFWGGVKI